MKKGLVCVIIFLVMLLNLLLIGGCSSPAEPGVSESIDSLEKITLGGVDQWILLQGDDISNPVMLVLHGGPGYAMMPLLHETNRDLEDYFTVVNWDQRGTGKSYSSSLSPDSMTLGQLVSDAHELTGKLKTRFDQEKIYLRGHSFGTILGILLIAEYPDDYLGFVGIGQVVDVIENEQLGYDFALREAESDGNTPAINELKQVGRPDDEGQYLDDSGYELTIGWVEYYGGDLYGKTDTGEIDDIIENSQVYAGDSEKIEEGWEFSQVLFLDSELWYLDFREKVKKVLVPVYFFTGRHDFDTPSELVEEYYDVLDAPVKEIVWFENSAHFPFYEESERFNRTIVEKLLESE